MTTAFDPNFVTAVNSHGDKQDIPADWLDHPALGQGFRLPASATPSLSWTREQLDAHAGGLGVDPTVLATKADVLDAITQTTDPGPGDGQDPGHGDDEEN